MNIQKFVANSSREALGKARMALGQSAVILRVPESLAG